MWYSKGSKTSAWLLRILTHVLTFRLAIELGRQNSECARRGLYDEYSQQYALVVLFCRPNDVRCKHLSWYKGCTTGISDRAQSCILLCIRAVPEIILREGPHFFFQTPPPPGHTWSQSPPTPRTRKCFNQPAPLWIKYTLTPRTSYLPTPYPSDTLSTKHPPPTGQKNVCGPPPPWG